MGPGIRGGGGSAGLRLALALAVASLFALPTGSLRFDFQSGKPKCISEDIKLHAMAVGKYNIVNPDDSSPLPDSHRVTVRISSPHGNSIHSADKVEAGNFAFTAMEAGDYLACFWTPDHKPPTTVTLEFDLRTGVAAKDWTSIARKGHLDRVELELLQLRDTVQSIHDDMFYLRLRMVAPLHPNKCQTNKAKIQEENMRMVQPQRLRDTEAKVVPLQLFLAFHPNP